MGTVASKRALISCRVTSVLANAVLGKDPHLLHMSGLQVGKLMAIAGTWQEQEPRLSGGIYPSSCSTLAGSPTLSREKDILI